LHFVCLTRRACVEARGKVEPVGFGSSGSVKLRIPIRRDHGEATRGSRIGKGV